ncbi:MAG: peptide chain release factor 1 [Eubacteriales bacterium]|nr:peptide chain release factor 1 [Eubacteriales bacterium]
MFEKLAQIEKKLVEIEEKLADPAIMSDMSQYTSLMKEYKKITPVVEKYREYKRAEADKAEGMEIIEMSDDAEMRTLAREQMEKAEKEMETAFDALRIMLLPTDPNDDKNVIIEIRGGAGGEEAALFAGVLYRMYNMYAEQAGYKSELLYANETELGGFKEISFTVMGDGAYSRFKFESGVHRVQRVPETESQGRIQTSTATVAVLPEVEDNEFQLNMEELEITTHRSAGAGGQHVNKTESAIRIIHIPTGTAVDCQDERSQLKNKERALKIMKSRLAELDRQKKDAALASERRSQVGTGDRSERIRTYNYPQGRVTDHRIGLTLYSLEAFANGKMDEMIDALITADRAAKLAAENE